MAGNGSKNACNDPMERRCQPMCGVLGLSHIEEMLTLQSFAKLLV